MHLSQYAVGIIQEPLSEWHKPRFYLTSCTCWTTVQEFKTCSFKTDWLYLFFWLSFFLFFLFFMMSVTTQNAPPCFILVLSEQVIHVHFSASDSVCDLQFQTKPPPLPPTTTTTTPPGTSLLPLMNLKHCCLTLIELNETLKFHSSDCFPPPPPPTPFTLWSFIQVTAPPPPPPPPTSLLIITVLYQTIGSCVRVEVAVLGWPS